MSGSVADNLEALVAVQRAELAAVRVYAVAGGDVSKELGKELARFSAQDAEHAAALERVIKGGGGSVDRNVPEPEPEPAGSEAALLKAAEAAESDAAAAAFEALQRLSGADEVKLLASIMASHGEHLVVLRQALDEDPVPRAFETGRG